MNPKYLYTIRWTQPYATPHLRPYLRGLHEQMEQVIERYLEESTNYSDAKAVIDKIRAL
jgi:hypothetical protein